jgi:glycosyltransferase involved in cell wall biosynthesis
MVIRNIVNELLKRDNHHQIYLILDKIFVSQKNIFVGKNIYPVFVWGGINLLSNIFWLPFLAKKYKLDIIVYQNFSTFWGRHKKIAYIYDILFKSYPQFFTTKEKVYFLPLKVLSNKSDAVITISESEKKRLLADGYNKPIDVIYPGIDEIYKPKEFFKAALLEEVREKYKLPEKYILYVGRLNVRKNIYNLLKAVSILNNDLKLVIVGEKDWKMFDFQKLIDELKIRNKIVFTGGVNNEELSVIYAMSSVFVFPSFAEGFGVPPLEAMASGIPIIVSNKTSLPEICGEAGHYINPNDPHDIASKLKYVLSNDEIIRQKIEIGLKWSKKFQWSKSVDQIINVCENLIYNNDN